MFSFQPLDQEWGEWVFQWPQKHEHKIGVWQLQCAVAAQSHSQAAAAGKNNEPGNSRRGGGHGNWNICDEAG